MKTTNRIIPFILFFLSACYASPTLDLAQPDRGPDICTGEEPVWIAQGELHSFDDGLSTSLLRLENGTFSIPEGDFVTLVPLDGEAFVDLAPGDEVHINIDWLTPESDGVKLLPYERQDPNKSRFTPGNQLIDPTEWQFSFTADVAIRELALEVQPYDPNLPITLGIYASVSRHCSGP